MATTEHNGAMTYKDENGNLYILYPVTQAENVLMADGETVEETVSAINAALDGKVPYQVITSGDFNNMTVPGIYTMRSTTTNAPSSGSYHSLIVLKSDQGAYYQQIAVREGTTDVYVRYGSNSSWQPWVKLAKDTDVTAHTGNSAVHVTAAEKSAWNGKAPLWVAETTGTNAFHFKVTLDPAPTELYVGMQVVIIPHATSTSVNATLNVNDKGAKRFKFRGETSGTLYDPVNSDFLTEGKPVLVMYDGSYWVINDSNVDSGKVTFKNYTNWNRKLSDSFCGGTAGGSYIRNASTSDSMSIFACSNGEAFSDVYFENLTHSFCSGVEVKRDYPATASYYGQYCMFAGGRYNNSSARDAVDVYGINLVKKTSTSLSEARYLAGSTSENIGSYVLIAGGSKNNDGSSNVVDAFNSSLVRSTPTTLSGAGRAEGSIVNKHAVFAVKTSSEIIVNAYSSSLTRTILSSLSENKSGIMGEHVSGYAIFAGGEKRNGSTSSSASSVDIYDGTLTKITTTVSFTPGSGMFEACGFSTQDNAFFLGEDLITTDYGYVFMFDKNLTLTTTGKTRVEGSLRDRPSTRLNFNTGVFLTSTSKAYALNTNTVINIPAYSAYKFNNDTKEKNTYNNRQVSYGSTPVNGYIRPLKTVSDI